MRYFVQDRGIRESQQVLFLIKEHLSKKKHLYSIKTPAGILLELSGSWEDDRKPEDIVKEIKRIRKNSKKLKKEFRYIYWIMKTIFKALL
jgi:hypothetical protein